MEWGRPASGSGSSEGTTTMFGVYTKERKRSSEKDGAKIPVTYAEAELR
jgi:hypothetical protein